QNPSVQNVRNQNGLIVVLGITNPNANQIRNGNVVAAWAEGNANGIRVEQGGGTVEQNPATIEETRAYFK
ncbi:hypothetical protein Tco_0027868, partial [Tanacetum coccineum]